MRPGAIISTLLASAAFGSSSAINRDYRSLAGGSIESFSESPRSLDVELVRSVVVDDSVNPAGVLKRQNGAATSCRTIHNWFKWKTFPDQQKYLPDNAKKVTTIGWTRMDKNFCYDATGKQVTDSTGKAEPSDATIAAGATDEARVAGWNFQGIVGGTVKNEYEPWNSNGLGAHVSSLTVKMDYKCPVSGCPLAQTPLFEKELYIRVFADGRAECRNGNFCLAGNEPLPAAWDSL